jgi:hypothetical protein
MRHRWKKISTEKIYSSGYEIKKQNVTNCMECIHCGLRKGNVRKRWFPILVYFKNNVILSTNKIPYKCTEAPNSIFISEKDFMV